MQIKPKGTLCCKNVLMLLTITYFPSPAYWISEDAAKSWSLKSISGNGNNQHFGLCQLRPPSHCQDLQNIVVPLPTSRPVASANSVPVAMLQRFLVNKNGTEDQCFDSFFLNMGSLGVPTLGQRVLAARCTLYRASLRDLAKAENQGGKMEKTQISELQRIKEAFSEFLCWGFGIPSAPGWLTQSWALPAVRLHLGLDVSGQVFFPSFFMFQVLFKTNSNFHAFWTRWFR